MPKRISEDAQLREGRVDEPSSILIVVRHINAT